MKRILVRCLCLVSISLLIAALSPTWADYFKSVKDIDAVPLPSGSKILVFADVNGVALVDFIESRITSRIQKKCDVVRVSARSLFPPTRTFSDEERAKIVMDAGIKAVLRISLTDSEQLTKEVGYVTPWHTWAVHTESTGSADTFELALLPMTPGPKLWVATAYYEEDDEENAEELAWDVVSDLLDNALLPKMVKQAKQP